MIEDDKDKLDQFEAELRQVRPRAVSSQVIGRIEHELAKRERASWRWPDRFLLASMSAGALAASVIVGILLTQSSPAPSWTGSAVNAAVSAPARPRLGDYPLAFARFSDWDMDSIK